MNLCLRIVFTSLWLFLTTSLLAQTIGFSLPFLNNIANGATVSLPVRVTNFDSVPSVQFVIKWDPAVLQFVTTDLYNLPGMNADDFGATNALDSGLLRFAWSAPNLNTGVSVVNNTSIFRLRLKAIGPVNSGSTVIFTSSPPTDFEVTQIVNGVTVGYNINQVNLTQGFVAIGYTVAAKEPSDSDFPIKIFPNPFSEKTQVSFDLEKASDVQISVADASGRTLFEKEMPRLSPGQHGTEIASPHLREKGIYFLILRTEHQSCVRHLFVF